MKPRERSERREVMKGLVGEARVQAHLGVMEAEQAIGPYVAEVAQTTREMAKDVAKRARAMKQHVAALKRRA